MVWRSALNPPPKKPQGSGSPDLGKVFGKFFGWLGESFGESAHQVAKDREQRAQTERKSWERQKESYTGPLNSLNDPTGTRRSGQERAGATGRRYGDEGARVVEQAVRDFSDPGRTGKPFGVGIESGKEEPLIGGNWFEGSSHIPSNSPRAVDPRAERSQGLRIGNLEAKELTWDEYNALTPRQRAVVDVNTALSKAIESDLKLTDKAPDADYDKLVGEIFGEGGGSDIYAPETVKVLQALGVQDAATDDLDNYLSGQSFVTDEELAQLSDKKVAAFLGMPGQVQAQQDDRFANAVALSEKGTSLLSDALSKGQRVLDVLSGVEAEPRIGFDPENARDAELQDFFNSLATGELTEIPDLYKAFDYFNATYPELTDDVIYDYFDTQLGTLDPGAADEFRAKFYGEGG